MYKVIAKTLKKKLQIIVLEVVQKNQVGFIKGRLLVKNVLLASELITDFHKEGLTSKGCLMIDLAKAYDHLSWEFILKILEAIDLPAEMISLIKKCICSVSYSVVVNGELNDHFAGKKGLCQCDPISSLLFVLVMDVLSKLLDKGAVNKVFKPHPSCKAPLVTHLSFGYVVLIFLDGSEESLAGIMGILEEFRVISGLRINRKKQNSCLMGVVQ